jgi:hypothetical protein
MWIGLVNPPLSVVIVAAASTKAKIEGVKPKITLVEPPPSQ